MNVCLLRKFVCLFVCVFDGVWHIPHGCRGFGLYPLLCCALSKYLHMHVDYWLIMQPMVLSRRCDEITW